MFCRSIASSVTPALHEVVEEAKRRLEKLIE
jgi:hypothetical protein